METIKRWKNWVRIKFLEIFTGRVRRFKIEDKDGKEHEVVVEQQEEKVCSHSTITEVAPTLWKCSNCPVYFQINYKVMVTVPELFDYMKKLAKHMEMELKDVE